ncbi:MAG: ATP-binding protein [Candidatus Orphnella occulta]|nr:ATP-binding protein [Candidatus Orphnella occulta]
MRKKLKIIIIDDSLTDREITMVSLKSVEEFEVEANTAQTGMEGLEKIDKEKFDLILLDYRMPGMSGLDFMNRLREKSIDIPVVMATGESDAKIAVEALKIGAYDYVSKDEIFKGGLSLVLKRTLERYGEKKEKQHLEAETKKYAQKLEKANNRLKKLDQAKNDFVSMVSHELRTPLAIMEEFASIVLDEIPGKLTKDQREYINIIKGNVDRLARLINNLLDISKIEARRVEIKKVLVDMAELVKGVVSTLKPGADEKHIELKTLFRVSSSDTYVDPDMIVQIFTNLIGNAIKFTPENGQVTITVTDQGKALECSVADTGMGIAPKNIDKVFGKFQQFERPAGSGAKGTGLGLAISKGLVRYHGGKIWVESKYNEGSKFIFILPKYTAESFLKQSVDNGIKQAMKNNSKMSMVTVSLLDLNRLQQELTSEAVGSILKEMEEAIRNSLRKEESNAIIKGADEVAVILTECNKEGVLRVEKRLEHALEEYLARKKMENKIRLQFGYATYPDDTRSGEELIIKAKKALN